MSWDNEKYEDHKKKVANNIASGSRTATDYMKVYKRAVKDENYELCKAIHEVLLPLNFDTRDTHQHIEELNPN